MRVVALPRAARVALTLAFSAPCLIMGCQEAQREPGRVETYNDRLVLVQRRVPGFGGMFTADDGRLVVYLRDPSKIAAARSAIESVFGPSQVPAAGLRALRGRYTVAQLKRWSERATKLLDLPGVTIVHLDGSRNRVAIGLNDATRTAVVSRALKSRGIPREAVVLEVKDPIRQLDMTNRPQSRSTRPAK